MRIRRQLTSLAACRRAAAAVGLALLTASPAPAQTPRLASPRLARQLDAPVTIAWQGQQLGPALARLAEVHDLPLWLDRRIDVGAPVELSIEQLPLGEALDRIASANEGDAWDWSTLSDVVYFGPRESARELATRAALLREAIARAPAEARRAWLAPAAWEYPRLSVPRELLRDALAPLQATLANEDAMPHDLWAARSLPAVAPIDRVLLLASGFDLMADPTADGRTWTLRPAKRPVTITRDYPLNDRTETALAALTAADPDITTRRRGRRLLVAGRWEDHESLRRAVRGESTDDPPPRDRPAPAGEQRFTLTIENQPVGRVVDQLATQLGLAVSWDPQLAAAAPPIGEVLISCDVRQVDLDGLLAAILEPAGLDFVLDGQTITIRASK